MIASYLARPMWAQDQGELSMKAQLLTGTMIAALAAAASFAHAKNEQLRTTDALVLPAQGAVTGTQDGIGGGVVVEQSTDKPTEWVK
jgi:hypothetical protein